MKLFDYKVTVHISERGIIRFFEKGMNCKQVRQKVESEYPKAMITVERRY